MPEFFSQIHVDVPTRSLQAYLILIGKAANRQTVTYEGMATAFRYDDPGKLGRRPVGRSLGPLMQWCKENDLPLLNCLVVSSVSGEPGTDLHDSDDPEEREKVYKQDWYDLVPPTVEELRASWDRLRA